MVNLATSRGHHTIAFTLELPQQVASISFPIPAHSLALFVVQVAFLEDIILITLLGVGDAELPEALVEQLRPGGRMVIPVGTNTQVTITETSPKIVESHEYSVNRSLVCEAEFEHRSLFLGVQDLVIIDKLLDGTIKKTIEMVVRYVPLI